jgi:hypothetical protein
VHWLARFSRFSLLVVLFAIKSFDYTFNQSMMGQMEQNFEFACHLPGHYEAGMRLPITINR